MADNRWWKQKEKANLALLKLSFYMVKYLPVFILKTSIFIVSCIYFILLKNERKNILNYRKNLSTYFSLQSPKFFDVCKNFFNFSSCICDKLKVYMNKITYKDLIFDDRKFLCDELTNQKRGQILLTSHFGNIEVSQALVKSLGIVKINILTYLKNSKEFNNILNLAGKDSIKLFYVDELDLKAMLELKSLLDSGEHIALMGDRIAINSDKIIKMKFLGHEANFSIGAYILAGILEAKISTFWCVKEKNKYRIIIKNLADKIVLKKDKKESVKQYVQKYIDDLEQMCKQYPSQWYNFFDFWSENEKEIFNKS